jgi:GNAT superfamily N-acetyltransferase
MNSNSPHLRAIRPDELSSLLDLYRHLHPNDPALPADFDVEGHWQRICANPLLHYFGAEVEGVLVSTCTLTVIPNLTRSAKPYGVIENVVTHPEFRRRGIGTSLLRFTLQFAWAHDCYKVMLLTGRMDPTTLRFYERAGFKAGVKTGFVAVP